MILISQMDDILKKYIYEPEDDSRLLLKYALKNLKNQVRLKSKVKVFEVGVGSGFVSLNLAKKFREFKVSFFGSDINKYAISYSLNRFVDEKLRADFKVCSFFEKFDERFDLILFNTPYLPLEDFDKRLEDVSIKDRAIYGGKKGYEVIEEFILRVYDVLDYGGSCIMVFSSLSNLDYILEVLKSNLFEFDILEKKNVFFEDIICLEFRRSKILDDLYCKSVESVRRFSAGKHSVILEGVLCNKNVMVKVGREQFLGKEEFFLEKLKKTEFSPKLLFSGKGYVVYEKIDGVLIGEFFKGCKSLDDLIVVLNNILKMCYELDCYKINKFEMTNPYKHIFVQDDLSVKMIDYERSIFAENPKNTRQVFEYFKRYDEVFRKLGLRLDFNKVLDVSRNLKKEIFLVRIEDLIE